jgi:hypothetical protein
MFLKLAKKPLPAGIWSWKGSCLAGEAVIVLYDLALVSGETHLTHALGLSQKTNCDCQHGGPSRDFDNEHGQLRFFRYRLWVCSGRRPRVVRSGSTSPLGLASAVKGAFPLSTMVRARVEMNPEC